MKHFASLLAHHVEWSVCRPLALDAFRLDVVLETNGVIHLVHDDVRVITTHVVTKVRHAPTEVVPISAVEVYFRFPAVHDGEAHAADLVGVRWASFGQVIVHGFRRQHEQFHSQLAFLHLVEIGTFCFPELAPAHALVALSETLRDDVVDLYLLLLRELIGSKSVDNAAKVQAFEAARRAGKLAVGRKHKRQSLKPDLGAQVVSFCNCQRFNNIFCGQGTQRLSVLVQKV